MKYLKLRVNGVIIAHAYPVERRIVVNWGNEQHVVHEIGSEYLEPTAMMLMPSNVVARTIVIEVDDH